jgi:hypothetical protein
MRMFNMRLGGAIRGAEGSSVGKAGERDVESQDLHGGIPVYVD